ncbi:hypothetical protein EYF80_052118 [Liparis tanakae]|uniref:Uncharacterized protein n=1 Tax=Liparis tanakae TaxID=230148 RepID=A0A4Z2FA27_9TELE|nr:hypothetical protein EYF80_052118 [Liparis tanakae]
MKFDMDMRVLQEENTDLHQNLLQTVVCIESLEAELQRTRDELSHVKEKYKSLLESHTGTKQANNLLGEHLQIAPPDAGAGLGPGEVVPVQRFDLRYRDGLLRGVHHHRAAPTEDAEAPRD